MWCMAVDVGESKAKGNEWSGGIALATAIIGAVFLAVGAGPFDWGFEEEATFHQLLIASGFTSWVVSSIIIVNAMRT